MEHIHIVLLLHHAESRGISSRVAGRGAVSPWNHAFSRVRRLNPSDSSNLRLAAVKQVPEFVILGGYATSVRLFFRSKNRLPQSAIPFQRGVGIARFDPSVNQGESR